jgi:predicted DNA-binding transcriptional regulator YafY
MDKIIIKYQSSNKEITEREISNVSSLVAENKNRIIYAYCHLREQIRTFILDSIIEIKINEEIVDKEKFWNDNINDRNKLVKDLEKMLKKKKKEFEEYVVFIESMLELIKEN